MVTTSGTAQIRVGCIKCELYDDKLHPVNGRDLGHVTHF